MGTDRDIALFAECKWTNEKVTKTGFTKGCIDKATDMGNVEFVSYDEMIDRSLYFKPSQKILTH